LGLGVPRLQGFDFPVVDEPAADWPNRARRAAIELAAGPPQTAGLAFNFWPASN